MLAKLFEQRTIRCPPGSAPSQQQGRRDRYDDGGDLADKPVANRQDCIGLQRLSEWHAVSPDTDSHADDEVQ